MITTTLACIDGGLICIPTLVILGILSVVCPSAYVFLKNKFKWCKKTCKCKCHKPVNPIMKKLGLISVKKK